MFTKQETFDRVARHLLTQNEQSIIWYDHLCECAYQSGPLKCAAGCLIPEGEYRVEYERNNVRVLCDLHQWFSFFGHETDLVSFLQDIHDTYQPNEWRERLKILGELEGLDVAVLNFN